MKTIITSFLGLGALSLFTSCSTTIEHREPSTHTTTTSETTLVRPSSNTVETTTTRY